MSQLPVLTFILALPLLGALAAAVLPRAAAWGAALLFALADLALAGWVIANFDQGSGRPQFTEWQAWAPSFGINYALGVDGLSLFLIGLNALLTVVAVGASYGYARRGDRPRQYLVLLLLLSAGMQGVFLATNLFLFYVFWEVMLVPAYLLVGIYGGPRRVYAAVKFFLFTAIGSLIMLVGVIALGAEVSGAGQRAYTLDLPALLAAGVPAGAQVPLFLAFAAAFAVKAGLFPFHSWVPDAYEAAPAPVAVLIAGVMAKTGVYGFLRFCIPLFPQAARTLAPLLGILAVVGILYFAVLALVQTDFRRLLAYVSISHMGVIVLGLFALNAQGVEGGVLQMVNHGITIAALFLIAGWIEQRAGTRNLTAFGGLATRLPLLATVFLIAALSALGLPGLNSFSGEFLAFLGAFRANATLGAIGTAVVIPAAWYMLRFFQGVMEGPPATDGAVGATLRAAGRAGMSDLRPGELTVLLPLLVLIFLLGAAPNIVTHDLHASSGCALTHASSIPITSADQC
jgi:NADH-quinone oxidoreductase subunit M